MCLKLSKATWFFDLYEFLQEGNLQVLEQVVVSAHENNSHGNARPYVRHKKNSPEIKQLTILF